MLSSHKRNVLCKEKKVQIEASRRDTPSALAPTLLFCRPVGYFNAYDLASRWLAYRAISCMTGLKAVSQRLFSIRMHKLRAYQLTFRPFFSILCHWSISSPPSQVWLGLLGAPRKSFCKDHRRSFPKQTIRLLASFCKNLERNPTVEPSLYVGSLMLGIYNCNSSWKVILHLDLDVLLFVQFQSSQFWCLVQGDYYYEYGLSSGSGDIRWQPPPQGKDLRSLSWLCCCTLDHIHQPFSLSKQRIFNFKSDNFSQIIRAFPQNTMTFLEGFQCFSAIWSPLSRTVFSQAYSQARISSF